MKVFKRIFILIQIAVLVLGMAACSAEKYTDDVESQLASAEVNVGSEVDSAENVVEPENTVEPQNNIEPENIVELVNTVDPQNVVEPHNDIELEDTQKEENSMQDASGNQITLTVNDTVMTATLVENSSTQALKDLLASGPLTISMRDYGSMEKVGSIGQSLPTNDEQINTEAGDLILFMGNAFVIYYAPNSWNFTRLGKINDVTAIELKEILGNGNVNVTLQLVP